MGFFSRKKKVEEVVSSVPKGFHELEVKEVVKLTPGSVKVSFIVPAELKNDFKFIPGQYLNLSTVVDGSEERRSYSICSGEDEALSVAIKRIDGGKMSNWANDDLTAGMIVAVAPPDGNFKLDSNSKNVVAIAAGSGITPIISMAKSLKTSGGKLKLFYGNRTEESIMFASEFEALDNVEVHHYLSGETKEGFVSGRIDKENIKAIIKADLGILRSDAFFLCGPEIMIQSAIETLELFGVPKEKIHYELYTTPINLVDKAPVEVHKFDGESHVRVILDDEEIEIKLASNGKTILDAVNKEGFDAPYSCRGGVCCTCRAKVLEGKVNMTLNYSLTDKEVEEGYILTCQSHPASENVLISYDV